MKIWILLLLVGTAVAAPSVTWLCDFKNCGPDGNCVILSGNAICKCEADVFGELCDVKCDTVCRRTQNLKCKKDSNQAPKENAYVCECIDSTYEFIDPVVPSAGCLKFGPKPCDRKNCEPDSTCDDSSGTAICKCKANVFGELCDDKCDTVCPGSENLKCATDSNQPPEKNAYVCECKDATYEFTDPQSPEAGCQKKVTSSCYFQNCGPDGICVISSGNAICKCNADVFGEWCSDKCDTVCPGSENLKCAKDSNQPLEKNAYVCECKDATYEFTDPGVPSAGCQRIVPMPCDTKNCGPDGNCDDLTGTAICKCTPNVFGEDCDKKCNDVCDSNRFLKCVEDKSQPIEKNAYKCECIDSTYEFIDSNQPSSGCKKITVPKPCDTKKPAIDIAMSIDVIDVHIVNSADKKIRIKVE